MIRKTSIFSRRPLLAAQDGRPLLPLHGFSLRWYRETFSSFEFREALKNSAIVAVTVSAVTLPLGTLAAYGLSRSSSRLRAPRPASEETASQITEPTKLRAFHADQSDARCTPRRSLRG